MRLIHFALLFAVVAGGARRAAAQTGGAAVSGGAPVSANGNASTAPNLSPSGNINSTTGTSYGASINSSIANAPHWGINRSGAPANFDGFPNRAAAALQVPGGKYGRATAFNSAPALGYMNGAAGMQAYPSSRWSAYAPQSTGRSFSNFGGRTFARGYYGTQTQAYGYGIYNNPNSYSMSSTNQGLYSGYGYGMNAGGGYNNGYGMNSAAPIGAGTGSYFGGSGGMFVGPTGNVGPR